jgi:hypothetical protein
VSVDAERGRERETREADRISGGDRERESKRRESIMGQVRVRLPTTGQLDQTSCLARPS